MRIAALASLFVLSCSAQAGDPGNVAPIVDSAVDGTAAKDAATDASDDAGFSAEAMPLDAPPEKIATVYANTDDTLYKMDPTSKEVTKIGDFAGLDASVNENMTDVAVDADGKVFGISVATSAAGHVFELTLPASGTGTVATKVVRKIASTSRFYALAFAPKGVLGTNEELVGGDANGDLYLIPTDGSTPTKVGDFGNWASGQPGGGSSGDTWQLSGDVVFFSNGGAPIGLATVRPCNGTTCKTENDVVIEIDMAALATKSPTAKLRKRFLGTGTGFGRLFGIGAWDAEVYAFERYSSSNPAQLVAISTDTGKGSVLKDFPDITTAKNGWSGAGVSTSAKITVPK